MRLLTAFLTGCVVLGLAAPAAGQSVAGAQSLQIPPDVRAEGMGRAFAVLNRSPYGAWGNVGALGFLRGVDAVGMRAQLVPGLADDVFYKFGSATVGYGPFQVAGLPVTFNFGVNQLRLDYGASFATEEGNPDPIGTFESWERSTGWTAAVGVGDLIGFGVGTRTTDIFLAPAEFTGGGGDARDKVTSNDYGILAASPPLELRLAGAEGPLATLTLLAGVSWSNLGPGIVLSEGRDGDPLPRVRRRSIGFTCDAVPMSDVFPPRGGLVGRWMREGHLLSISAATGEDDGRYTRDLPPSAGGTDHRRRDVSNYHGWEVRFMDLIAVRRGWINDEPGSIYGSTTGVGISLFGIAGLDYAEIPQYYELETVTKWGVWIRLPLDLAGL